MGSMYLPDWFVGRRNRFYSIGIFWRNIVVSGQFVCLFGVVVGWLELLLLWSVWVGLVSVFLSVCVCVRERVGG